jgi:predicted metal-dependent enzyme (double-stranded beta helix superfamily)
MLRLGDPATAVMLAPHVGGTALAGAQARRTDLAAPTARAAVLACPTARAAVFAAPTVRGMEVAAPAASGLSPARLGQIARALAERLGDWSDVLRFDPGRRWYRRLALADDHEVWLLTWLPGQGTGFHDHGHAAGAFAVARGQLREQIAAGPVQRVRRRTVTAGGVRAFGSQHVHDVANVSGEPAVSVHAYSPPLTAMRRYDLTQAGLVHVATESAEQGW